MATLEHSAAKVDLCDTVALDDWEGKTGHRGLKVEVVSCAFSVSDDGSVDEQSAPVRGVHWVMFHGSTLGNKAGLRAPPMMYDPGEAVIDMHGRQVHALGRAWHLVGADSLTRCFGAARRNGPGNQLRKQFG